MDTDEFTQNIRLQVLQLARDHIKQEYKEKLIGLPCKNCNLPELSVKEFSDGDNSVIAHLECTNCGFEDSLNINLATEGVDDGLKSVKKEFEKLGKAIEDTNRRMNQL